MWTSQDLSARQTPSELDKSMDQLAAKETQVQQKQQLKRHVAQFWFFFGFGLFFSSKVAAIVEQIQKKAPLAEHCLWWLKLPAV